MNGTLTADMIRMPHNDNVRVERLQGMLRPRRRHVHRLSDLGRERRWTGSTLGQVTTYLLVHNDVHFDTSFSPALKDPIETVILVKFAWTPKI